MAKGAYTFLSYPESTDIEKIKVALDSANWDFCISPVHDKDHKDDGTLKKPHYHWIVGFRRKIPDYKEFKSYIKDVGGVVGKYNDTIVHDVEALYAYLTHENEIAEGKEIYNAEDIFHSETWDIQSYITYTDKREKKHEKAVKGLQELICYISKTKCSFAQLVDNYASDSEYLTVIFNNAYAINLYIRSISLRKECV